MLVHIDSGGDVTHGEVEHVAAVFTPAGPDPKNSLSPDLCAAPTVQWIFAQWPAGQSVASITR